MKCIALIPARCGSKGIPLKNLYPINGKPLINYAIEAVKQSNIDECYVSTDCIEIQNYIKSLSVNLIKRPQEISQDNSKTVDCIKHAINHLNLNDNDIILTIQPTTPLISSKDINLAINKLKNNEYKYIISVCYNHKILWKLDNEYMIPYNHNPFNRLTRQESEKIFSETGSIYGTKVQYVKENNTMYGIDKVGYIEIPKSRSFEIDDYEDVKILEAMIINNNINNIEK